MRTEKVARDSTRGVSDFQPLVLTVTPFSWQHRDPIPEQRGPGLPGPLGWGAPALWGSTCPLRPSSRLSRRGRGSLPGRQGDGFLSQPQILALLVCLARTQRPGRDNRTVTVVDRLLLGYGGSNRATSVSISFWQGQPAASASEWLRSAAAAWFDCTPEAAPLQPPCLPQPASLIPTWPAPCALLLLLRVCICPEAQHSVMA